MRTKRDLDLQPRPTPTLEDKFPPRPPVVVILGHVNHGKTTLLGIYFSILAAAGLKLRRCSAERQGEACGPRSGWNYTAHGRFYRCVILTRSYSTDDGLSESGKGDADDP